MAQESSIYTRAPWERHFQTFVGLAILSMGIWVINSTQLQTVAVAVQTEQIKQLTKQIDSLTEIAADRYTAKDAEQDFAVRDAEMVRIWVRLREIEQGRPR